MKPLSETYKEQGIAFSFPIEIRNGIGRITYYENSEGFRYKREHDADGTATYYENSKGLKYGTPRSSNTN